MYIYTNIYNIYIQSKLISENYMRNTHLIDQVTLSYPPNTSSPVLFMDRSECHASNTLVPFGGGHAFREIAYPTAASLN